MIQEIDKKVNSQINKQKTNNNAHSLALVKLEKDITKLLRFVAGVNIYQ